MAASGEKPMAIDILTRRSELFDANHQGEKVGNHSAKRVAALLTAALAMGASAASASAATDVSSQVAAYIKSSMQKQFNKKAKLDQTQLPGVRFRVTKVECVQVNQGETYKCVAYYRLLWKRDNWLYDAVVNAVVSNTSVFWQAGGGTRIG